MTRRKFSRKLNIEVVRLVTDRGVAVAQTARDLDLSESVLRRWMRELIATPATTFPGKWADAGRFGRDCSAEEEGRTSSCGA